MSILPLILFLAFVFNTNAYWHIKKTDPAKEGAYSNPGKRSVHDQQFYSSPMDCSKSFSQLNSYDEQLAWIMTCLNPQLATQIDDNSISSESDDLQLESTLKLRPISRPADDREYQSSFDRFISKLRQREMAKRK